MAFEERNDDNGTMDFPLNHCNVRQDSRSVQIETAMVDAIVYYHRSSEGREYLVVDIDTNTDEPFPMRIYRNDGLVHQEGL